MIYLVFVALTLHLHSNQTGLSYNDVRADEEAQSTNVLTTRFRLGQSGHCLSIQ